MARRGGWLVALSLMASLGCGGATVSARAQGSAGDGPGCAAVPGAAGAVDATAAVHDIERELDDLHDAAAHADEARYLGHFARESVFLGTDATERWDLPAFTAYVHPYFSKGKGWTFHPVRRAVTLDADGARAWFDEVLRGERLGPARGSGVLSREGTRWLVRQYNLTLTIPNERFDEVHALLEHPPREDLHRAP